MKRVVNSGYCTLCVEAMQSTGTTVGGGDCGWWVVVLAPFRHSTVRTEALIGCEQTQEKAVLRQFLSTKTYRYLFIEIPTAETKEATPSSS